MEKMIEEIKNLEICIDKSLLIKATSYSQKMVKRKVIQNITNSMEECYKFFHKTKKNPCYQKVFYEKVATVKKLINELPESFDDFGGDKL